MTLKKFFQKLRVHDTTLAQKINDYCDRHPWRYTGIVGGVVVVLLGSAYFLFGGGSDRKEHVLKSPFYRAFPSDVSGISFELSRILERGPSQFQLHGEVSLTDITPGSLRRDICGLREDTLEVLFDDTLKVVVAPNNTVRYGVHGHFSMITTPGGGKSDFVILGYPLFNSGRADTLDVYGVLARVAKGLGQKTKFSDFSSVSVNATVNGNAVDGGLRAVSHPEEFQFSSSSSLKVPVGKDTLHYGLDTNVRAVLQ